MLCYPHPTYPDFENYARNFFNRILVTKKVSKQKGAFTSSSFNVNID